MSVLVLEEDPEWRTVLRRVVRAALPGCTILEADNVREAMRLLMTERPTHAVVDVVLPGSVGNGLDVAAAAVRQGARTILSSSHVTERVRGASFVSKDDILTNLGTALTLPQ